MRFFLLGFMGCGKSFWGRRLGEWYALPWIDLDEHIVQQEQMSIARLFSTKGEATFRELEAHYLHRLVQTHDDLLLSTGGGTPCHHDLMNEMNRLGTCIYLKAGVDYLFRRLQQEQEERPLLQSTSPEELRRFIEELLAVREPVYARARYIVDVESAERSTFDRIFQRHV